MVRVSKLLVMIGLITLLVACGGAAPTATPPPTATPAPTNTAVPPTATVAPTATPVPPTATVAPTNTPVPPTATIAPTATKPPVATVAPTRAATTAASGAAVTDGTGKCRMTLDPVFTASAGNKDTYATADNLALLTFAGTDTPGLNLDAATTAFIGGFQSVVTGYVETGRETSKDARGDVQIVSFTGAVSGQQAKGVFYFVQNNNVLCSLVALAIPPGDQRYGDAAQRTADSLRIIGATASGNPPPLATVAPTRAPVSTVAPTRAASTAPIAGGGAVVVDSSGKCQMTLPATFKAGASPDNFQTADNLAIITLGGTDTGGLAIADAANLYIEAFKGAVAGYVETGRQTATVNGGQEQTVTYTGTLVGQPVKGVLYFFQVGTTFCSLSGVALPPGDTKYQADLQTMIDSLEPVKR